MPCPHNGIDSVRLRARLDGSPDPVFVEVAILDPNKPCDLEVTIVRGERPAVWAVIDVNDLLSAVQVIRSTAVAA